MRSDFAVGEDAVAFVFPGQGAHGPEMLEPFRAAPRFAELHDRVCTLLGEDPSSRAPERMNENAVSSLYTVLASVCALDLLREQTELEPAAYAGYSVGQWTAVHAAGRIGVDELFEVVAERARLMDACLREDEPSGMLAVIGVRERELSSLCARVAAQGEPIHIANYNAPGQLTLSGSDAALTKAEDRLGPLRPKRVVRLPVAGAWHSPLLERAVPGLAELLERIAFEPPTVDVIDNVSGDWLPRDPARSRAALARQVAQPVRWMHGVRTMAASGVRHFIEVGYGDVLTKFGFFIDRSLRHHAVAPLPRVRAR